MTSRRGPVDRGSCSSGAACAHMAITVVLGGITALLVIAQACCLPTSSPTFDGTITVAGVRAPLTVLLVVVVARAATAWYTEVSANRVSSRVKSQLRVALVEKLAAEPPRLGAESEGHLTTLVTHGWTCSDGYFSRYLPQLVLAVIVPVAVIAAVCTRTGSRPRSSRSLSPSSRCSWP